MIWYSMSSLKLTEPITGRVELCGKLEQFIRTFSFRYSHQRSALGIRPVIGTLPARFCRNHFAIKSSGSRNVDPFTRFRPALID